MNSSILYIVSEDWYFLSHRLSLALEAKKKGYLVTVLCKDTGKFNEIKNYDIKCYNISWNRKISLPWIILKDVKKIKSIINDVNPDIVHLVSLLPIILGFLAINFKNKLKIVVTITGLGTIFIKMSLKIIFIRFFIKILLLINFRRKNLSVIVQNIDDYNFCIKKLMCPKDNLFLIRGSGIDINFHHFIEEPVYPPIVIAFVGRLLEDKGLKVLIKAFEHALKTNANLKLILAGSIDKFNPSSVTESYLSKVLINKKIEWLNEVKDIREVWKVSHIAILPSRREGLPKSLLEAAANGRAIISTDVPGSREIALNQINAVLVPVDNILELSKAINFLALNNDIRKKYGLKSRKIVESDMSEDKVNSNILDIYNNI